MAGGLDTLERIYALWTNELISKVIRKEEVCPAVVRRNVNKANFKNLTKGVIIKL